MSQDEDDEAFRRRAAARASWAVRRRPLEAEGRDDDLSGISTAEERLGMMWELALSAWTLAGKALPRYARAQTPGRILRPQDSDQDRQPGDGPSKR